MVKIIIVYLYISTIWLVIDLIKNRETFTKHNEDLDEFNNLGILFLAAFVIIGGILTIIPYYTYRLIKKIGS